MPDRGAQLVKEVATKTNDVAGDGATTATVLAQALINEGMKNIAAGANPIILRKGMKKASDVAIEALDKMSRPVTGKEHIAKVAAISAGNEEVGQMIADDVEGEITIVYFPSFSQFLLIYQQYILYIFEFFPLVPVPPASSWQVIYFFVQSPSQSVPRSDYTLSAPRFLIPQSLQYDILPAISVSFLLGIWSAKTKYSTDLELQALRPWLHPPDLI